MYRALGALGLVLLSVVEFQGFGQQIRFVFDQIPPEVIQQRLRHVSDKDAAREADLRKLFEESGCAREELIEQVVEAKRPPNLSCTLPGKTDSVIIVGAHFDHVERGRGVVDDWSGASLLPSLFTSLRARPRQHTFVFVGFTEEEKGMVGSGYYSAHLTSEQVAKTRAMINLECLGLTPSKVWVHHADKLLLTCLLTVAHSQNLPLQGVNVEKVGDDDAESFIHRKIATITIHSVTQETFPVLHSLQDNFSAINFKDLYQTYQLIAAYLAYLDTALN